MNNTKHTQHNRLASGHTKLRKDTLTIQPLTIHVFLLLLTLHSELQRKLSINGGHLGTQSKWVPLAHCEGAA